MPWTGLYAPMEAEALGLPVDTRNPFRTLALGSVSISEARALDRPANNREPFRA